MGRAGLSVVLGCFIGAAACGNTSKNNNPGSAGAAGSSAGTTGSSGAVGSSDGGMSSGGGGASSGGSAGAGGASYQGASFYWLEPTARHLTLAEQAPIRAVLRTLGAWTSADGSVVFGESLLLTYTNEIEFTDHAEVFRWTEATGTVDLGYLPGFDPPAQGRPTRVNDVSADGSVVVGTTQAAGNLYAAFRWTLDSGMEQLHPPAEATIEDVMAVNDDGSVVLGALDTPAGLRVFRWTLGAGITVIDPLPGHTDAYPVWLSADGSIIAGYSMSDVATEPFRWSEQSGIVGLGVLAGETNCRPQRQLKGVNPDVVFGYCQDDTFVTTAFRWTQASGMQALGLLPGHTESYPSSMSSDGTAIAGDTDGADGSTQGFYWREGSGLIGLGWLPGQTSSSPGPLWGMSADGSVVVGNGSGMGQPTLAFHWTEGLGMVSLNPLPGHETTGIGTVSADGSMLAGSSAHQGQTSEESDYTAVTWDANGNPSSLPTALAASGIDVDGVLQYAYVNPDGRTLLGDGTDSTGAIRAFVVRLAR